MRGVSPSRHSERPSSSAVCPRMRSSAWLRMRSPARFTRRRQPVPSNANTATSISSITLRSSAVASSAPSLCLRSVSPSAFTSHNTSPSTSSRFAPRARMEKSPSRNAASKFGKRAQRKHDAALRGKCKAEPGDDHCYRESPLQLRGKTSGPQKNQRDKRAAQPRGQGQKQDSALVEQRCQRLYFCKRR